MTAAVAEHLLFAPVRGIGTGRVESSTPLLMRWCGQFRSITGTSASYEIPPTPHMTQIDPLGSVPHIDPATCGSAIYEIRRLSGLTWDELAEMLSVSRQATNDWANGKPMKPVNVHKVQGILLALRNLPRLEAAHVRAALLARQPSGHRALDMIRAGNAVAAIEAVLAVPPLLHPLAPEDTIKAPVTAFLDRLHDRPVPASGPLAKTRSRRGRGRQS